MGQYRSQPLSNPRGVKAVAAPELRLQQQHAWDAFVLFSHRISLRCCCSMYRSRARRGRLKELAVEREIVLNVYNEDGFCLGYLSADLDVPFPACLSTNPSKPFHFLVPFAFYIAPFAICLASIGEQMSLPSSASSDNQPSGAQLQCHQPNFMMALEDHAPCDRRFNHASLDTHTRGYQNIPLTLPAKILLSREHASQAEHEFQYTGVKRSWPITKICGFEDWLLLRFFVNINKLDIHHNKEEYIIRSGPLGPW